MPAFLNSFEVNQCCFYFSVNEKDHFWRICYFPELRNPRQVMKILNFQSLIFTFKMICIFLLYLVQKLKPRWLKGKEFSCQCRRCRRHGFDPWVGRKWQTHSSILAWEIPCTEEPGGLQSMGSQRVGHHWACTHAMYAVQLDVLI